MVIKDTDLSGPSACSLIIPQWAAADGIIKSDSKVHKEYFRCSEDVRVSVC